MNFNQKLHPSIGPDAEGQLHEMMAGLSYNDTCIKACPYCGEHILNFCEPIYNYNFHSGANFGEVDDEVAARMKTEQAI